VSDPTALSAVDNEKRAVGEAAAAMVEDGMTIGLGTGSTVAFLLPALAQRHLSLVCVATSPATASIATSLGLHVEPFGSIARLDIAIDGADQVDSDCWLIKGGGGAHTREKVVAAASDRFVVIVSAEKIVDELVAPVPLELLEYGYASTVSALGDVRRRDVPLSPDGGIIADYFGPIADREALATRLDAAPGVVGHGLFRPELVYDVLIAAPGGVRHRRRD
jgi:ribose 5-phosphate isomerase A